MANIFCNNGPCEAPAVWYYITEKGFHFHLCETCKDAFELGQVNPDAGITSIDEEWTDD
jgi:hypothetical protein